MNRTLIEKVRCMLSEAKLPKHFWGEALYTTVHVINLSPVVVLNSEMSNKIWFGKNVKYDHLSWMQSQGNVPSLAMVRMNLVIGSMILLKRSLLEVVM